MLLQMLRKTTILMLCALTLSCTTFAQEAWSLQKCISHAKQNNLTLKQADLAVKQAELLEQGSRMARLPNVNGRGNFGYNYGRSIDPTTNAFNNTRTGFNNIGIDAGITVYNGGRIKNTIKQSQYDLLAAKAVSYTHLTLPTKA